MRKRANVQWPSGSQRAVGGRSNVRVSGKEEIRGHRIRVPSAVPSGQDQHPDCPLFPALKMVLAVALRSYCPRVWFLLMLSPMLQCRESCLAAGAVCGQSLAIPSFYNGTLENKLRRCHEQHQWMLGTHSQSWLSR